MLVGIAFGDVPSLIRALASVKVLHLQIGANLGEEGPLQEGDDYFLEYYRVGRYTPEETSRLQITEHLERKTVVALKGLFPEGVVVEESLKTKPQLVRSLLQAYSSDEDGVEALRRKLNLKQHIRSSQSPWLLVYSAYKIRQAHDDAYRQITMRQYEKDIHSTLRIPSIVWDVPAPCNREGLPKSWNAGDDVLVTGVHRRSTAVTYYKAAYRLRPIGDTTNIMEGVTRHMGMPPEDVPNDWEAQIETIVAAHREHITFSANASSHDEAGAMLKDMRFCFMDEGMKGASADFKSLITGDASARRAHRRCGKATTRADVFKDTAKLLLACNEGEDPNIGDEASKGRALYFHFRAKFVPDVEAYKSKHPEAEHVFQVDPDLVSEDFRVDMFNWLLPVYKSLATRSDAGVVTLATTDFPQSMKEFKKERLLLQEAPKDLQEAMQSYFEDTYEKIAFAGGDKKHMDKKHVDNHDVVQQYFFIREFRNRSEVQEFTSDVTPGQATKNMLACFIQLDRDNYHVKAQGTKPLNGKPITFNKCLIGYRRRDIPMAVPCGTNPAIAVIDDISKMELGGIDGAAADGVYGTL